MKRIRYMNDFIIDENYFPTSEPKYDKFGHIIWTDNNYGFETTYTYDKVGRIVKKQKFNPITCKTVTINYKYNDKKHICTEIKNGKIIGHYRYDRYRFLGIVPDKIKPYSPTRIGDIPTEYGYFRNLTKFI